MAYSPSDIDCKAATILPAHVNEPPQPQGLTSDSKPVPVTWRRRFQSSIFGKPIVYFGVCGLLAVILTLVLGWLLIPAIIPTVTLRQGTFRGVIINRPNFPKPVEAHLCIPYALPPVGELRFARPRPVLASNETFEASRFGPRCPGKPLIPLPDGGDNGNEDCLTVNVFRPAASSEDDDEEVLNLLPVAVYFHGGAFNRGAAKGHDTAAMVAWAEPFVAVTFNYRLGALGFLNSIAAAEEGILNLGLHDQIQVLQWVQENIAAFGGDRAQVTIMGVSAGAHSVGHHLLNDKSVFHRAIMESGGPYSRALHHFNSSLNTQQSSAFMSLVGCLDSDIACLRTVNASKLVNASDTVFEQWNPSLRWAWQPVIDGELVPGRSLEQQRPSNIPILTGFSTNEGSMYVPRNLTTDKQFDSFFSTLLPQVARNESISHIYPATAYPEWRSVGKEFRRLEAAYGQYAYSCSVRQTASIFSSSDIPTNATRTAPVYLFHWAVNRTVLGGAGHGDYVAYETMDSNVRSISRTQREIATLYHGYLTNFIVSGNPNHNRDSSVLQGGPEWLPVQEGSHTMIFGLGNDERAGGTHQGVAAQFMEDDWARDECDFWHRQSRKYED
ncbi:uncharacterized protein A1O9_01520 [Exophiala aquamarina CBS 119918]|uniref:Carboxylic ester hydrolase n=1 Tax=Exophiala aquamarina CBS 119918 TaxID=1182545 RepID=A0A072PUV1_9EURO|nr:uncharacterized protein A1O9_01520 [Exophiala aquamarina CBS 119918]KEF63542.1 hypothetical protein A1O9_01520 [Exophiala aquamarina CBS 119918]